MNSRLSSLSLVKQALRNTFASTRSDDDLEIIYDFVTKYTEIEHDQLWRLLSKPQRLQLCGYFRYDSIEAATSLNLNGVNSGTKLMIFVKGEAKVIWGNHSLQLDPCHGPCLGVIPLALDYRDLLDQTAQAKESRKVDSFLYMNTYQQFLQVASKDAKISVENARPSVFFQHVSNFISLYFQDTQMFLERYFDRKISVRVLQRFNCQELIKPRFQFITFPKDHPIQMEGRSSEKIILTLRGTCTLHASLDSGIVEDNNDSIESSSLQSSEASNSTNVDICQVQPLSFLAFHPHFYDQVECHMVSATALTKVQVLVLNAKEFKEQIDSRPSIREAFEELARQQVHWLQNQLPKFLKKKLNQSKEDMTDDFVEEFPTASIVDIENLIKTRARKNPRTNKYKVLQEFKRLVNGETESDDASEYEDLFLRFAFENEHQRELDNTPTSMHHSDFHLTPFPSILLSRKRFGKTLPCVSKSEGYLNPFDIMEM